MGIRVDQETMDKILATPGVIVGPSTQLSQPAAHLEHLPDAPAKKSTSKAKGRHTPGQKNKLEQAYEDHVLKPLRDRGEILGFWFEPIALILADRCRYTPDFMVQLADGTIEFREIKAIWKTKAGDRAGWQEDGRIKIRVAAGMYPIFGFLAIAGAKRKGGWEWQEERFS